MKTFQMILFVICVFLIICSAIVKYNRKKRHNIDVFSDRDANTVKPQVRQFLLDHHISDREYDEVIKVISYIVKVDPALVLPSDCLGKEIYLEPSRSGESDYVWILEDLGLLEAEEAASDNIKTIGDLLLLYHNTFSPRKTT